MQTTKYLQAIILSKHPNLALDKMTSWPRSLGLVHQQHQRAEPPPLPTDLQGADDGVGGSWAGNAEDSGGDVKAGRVIIHVIHYDHYVRLVTQIYNKTKSMPNIKLWRRDLFDRLVAAYLTSRKCA